MMKFVELSGFLEDRPGVTTATTGGGYAGVGAGVNLDGPGSVLGLQGLLTKLSPTERTLLGVGVVETLGAEFSVVRLELVGPLGASRTGLGLGGPGDGAGVLVGAFQR